MQMSYDIAIIVMSIYHREIKPGIHIKTDT